MPSERPVQTTLAFHASRIVIDLGVLVAMASMSMTFVNAPSGGRSALAADALPAVLLLLPIFAVTLIPDHTRPLHPVVGWTSMVLALAALPYAFIKLLDARILADTLGGSVGIGPAVLLVGCAITLAGVGVGIIRDLMGWPSGGTPQRSAAFTTKHRATTADGPRAQTSGGARTDVSPTTSPAETTKVETGDQPTRVLEPEPSPTAAPSQPTRDSKSHEPVVADQSNEHPPDHAEPEIVFPDTGAVVDDPEPEPGADGGLLDTAERADAALTESLLSSMFDESDDGGGDDAEDDL